MQYVLVAVYIVLTISGLVLIKKGGNPGTVNVNNGEIHLGMNLISLVGFICYICSFLLYTRIVVMFDLSYITPICTGITQICILVASYFAFHEQISKQGIIGASLVIIGIVIMNWKK